MLPFLRDKDDNEDAKAIEIPRVFSENSRAKKSERQANRTHMV